VGVGGPTRQVGPRGGSDLGERRDEDHWVTELAPSFAGARSDLSEDGSGRVMSVGIVAASREDGTSRY
jgi:hypothetical protein